MGKKKEVKKRIPLKTIDLINIIEDTWREFHDSNDSEEKTVLMMDMIMGIFVYNLSRYDYSNYLKFINEVKEEGQENGRI